MELNNQQPHIDPFKKVDPPHKDFLHRHQVAGYIFVGSFLILAILFNYKMRLYREMMNVDFPVHQIKHSEASSIKTYSNTKYGYQLSYPATGIVQETDDNSYMVVEIKNVEEGILRDGEFYAKVYVAKRENEKMPCKDFLSDEAHIAVAGTSVDAFLGTYTADREPVSGIMRGLCVEIPGKYTFVHAIAPTESAADKILSSFKFIE